MGAAGVMNISRPSPAALRSASLLPFEIVRIKSMQVVKLDRVVVARRMQDQRFAAERASLSLTLGSLTRRLW
jgi:hypothetical protein